LVAAKAFSSSQTFCHFFSTTLWLYTSAMSSPLHFSYFFTIHLFYTYRGSLSIVMRRDIAMRRDPRSLREESLWLHLEKS
jgi:hypothetical protein